MIGATCSFRGRSVSTPHSAANGGTLADQTGRRTGLNPRFVLGWCSRPDSEIRQLHDPRRARILSAFGLFALRHEFWEAPRYTTCPASRERPAKSQAPGLCAAGVELWTQRAQHRTRSGDVTADRAEADG